MTSRSSSNRDRQASRCTSSSLPSSPCAARTPLPSASSRRSARAPAYATCRPTWSRSSARSLRAPPTAPAICERRGRSSAWCASAPVATRARSGCCRPTPGVWSSSPWISPQTRASSTRTSWPANWRRSCAARCPIWWMSSCIPSRRAGPSARSPRAASHWTIHPRCARASGATTRRPALSVATRRTRSTARHTPAPAAPPPPPGGGSSAPRPAHRARSPPPPLSDR